MATERVNIDISVTWVRLRSIAEDPYKWGARKASVTDSKWLKRSVIYRWVKNSTKEIAVIGETERKLTERINNYISASPGSSAGATNKRVYKEQKKLSESNDYLYLEVIEEVAGYNLNNNRERKLAESLLIGYYRPYLQ